MTPSDPLIHPRRDLLVVAASVTVFALLSVRFEFSERLLALTQPHEHYQIDELPGVVLFLACALAWYAWRRVGEARAEIARRAGVEERLRHALAENRDLALAAVRVQEDERRNLAREMHDELGQHLNAIKIDAVALRERDFDDTGEATRIVAGVGHVEAVVRDIVRRLRPAGLDELGLPAAIEHCVEGWRRRLPNVEFRLSMADDISPYDEVTNITLYRLLQEGLTNVARHAKAALVEVSLIERGGSEVELIVRDDGIGLTSRTTSTGIGLVGMRERVEALAGRFEILSASRRGFAFAASIPLRRQEVA